MRVDIWRLGLVMVLSAWTTFSLLLVRGLYQTSATVSEAQMTIAQPLITANYVYFTGVDQPLRVSSWRKLNTGRQWSYVSSGQAIDVNFVPELTNLSVAHGDWIDDSRAQPIVNQQLQLLAKVAETANVPIIVTSAYRSAEKQQQLVTENTAQYGPQYSDDYVAAPGQSEHQLGLAIDFSSFSEACRADFTQCWLDDKTASWLADHAHEYGFILRYPEGKEEITGVKAESWHFRYVGKELATIIQKSGLTFDEIYQQLVTARDQFAKAK